MIYISKYPAYYGDDIMIGLRKSRYDIKEFDDFDSFLDWYKQNICGIVSEGCHLSDSEFQIISDIYNQYKDLL
jgi:hypothetical protein